MKTIRHLGTVITALLVVIGMEMNRYEFIDNIKGSEEKKIYFFILAVTEGLISYLVNEEVGYT